MTDQTVYIIDDDDAVKGCICELVKSVGLQAQTFSNALEFLDHYNVNMSGCIVLDVRMAMMSGLELQRNLNTMNSILPIIFVSGHADVPMAVEALKAGAFDFVQKPYRNQSLLETINAALDKDSQSREILTTKCNVDEKFTSLTSREREVVDLLISGNNTKQIAKVLNISPRTVEIHRQKALKKFSVDSLAGLLKLVNKWDDLKNKAHHAM